MFLRIVFQELGVSCVYFNWLRLVGTTDPKTGSVQVSKEWPFDIREPKTPPSDGVKHVHFKHTSHENARNSDTAQNIDYLGFSLLPITSLYSQDHPIPLSHKYPKPFIFRRWIWGLTALQTNPFFAANLGVSGFWLAVQGANEPGLVTVVGRKVREGNTKNEKRFQQQEKPSPFFPLLYCTWTLQDSGHSFSTNDPWPFILLNESS